MNLSLFITFNTVCLHTKELVELQTDTVYFLYAINNNNDFVFKSFLNHTSEISIFVTLIFFDILIYILIFHVHLSKAFIFCIPLDLF